MDLREYVTRIPRPAFLAINLALVVFLGITNYLTGPQLSFSIFYLIPVSLTTLRLKTLDASLIALVSAITWLWADLASGGHYSHWMIPYWNASVRLGYFLLHATLLGILLRKIDVEKDLARRDPLTGAANWRCFQEYALREMARARRARRPLTVAYLDLDDFKTVNDTLGHEAGDDLLRTIVELMQANIRPTDMLARTGGDEFVLMFPETDYVGGDEVLRRLHAKIQTETTRSGWPVGCSIGAITFNVLPSSPDALVKRVDELMYSVKRNGKGTLRHEAWPAAPGSA